MTTTTGWSAEMDRRLEEIQRDPLKYVQVSCEKTGRDTLIARLKEPKHLSRTPSLRRP